MQIPLGGGCVYGFQDERDAGFEGEIGAAPNHAPVELLMARDLIAVAVGDILNEDDVTGGRRKPWQARDAARLNLPYTGLVPQALLPAAHRRADGL